MSDEPRLSDARAVWKDQPKEHTPVTMDPIVDRRAEQLFVSTRWEILMSLAAPLFFIAVLVWRLPPAGFPLQPVGLAAAALWIALTLFLQRQHIWGAAPDAASTGLAYYRRELEMRRDHLRNAWLWHGPLLVALIFLAATFAGAAFPGGDRFRNAAPLLGVLALWIVVGIIRRRRQAAGIQREIDEIDRLREQH
jgi:hypothetical protein